MGQAYCGQTGLSGLSGEKSRTIKGMGVSGAEFTLAPTEEASESGRLAANFAARDGDGDGDGLSAGDTANVVPRSQWNSRPAELHLALVL